MKFPRPSLVPLVLLLQAGAAALAQESPAPESAALADLSLEQLMDVRIEKVFSASKYEQKVTQAPASVTIVSSNEIEKYGQRTLADVLRSVRGLYVSDDGNYSYLGARGFLRPGDYNSRMLVLVDGHRMNESVYDSAYFGHDSAVDVDLIERVEFIRGPSSSIYGSSAFFGVVNIVTKQVDQLKGTSVSAEGGSFGTYKGRLSHGQRFGNGLELVLSASWMHSDGRDEIYYPELDQRLSADPRANNDGIARNQDDESAANFFASVKQGGFNATAGYTAREKTVPTASFGTLFNVEPEVTTDRRGYLDLRYDREINADLRLAARGTYDRYTYVADYIYDYAAAGDPPDITRNHDDVLGEWLGAELQLTARLAGRHTLVFGGEFRRNLHQRQVNYDLVSPPVFTINDDRQTSTGALYAQGEFLLRPGLLLNAGLRYDHYYGSFGGTLNPRLGLIHNVAERTTLKALYGQAFRAPNAYERFYFEENQGPLDPETIRTYELVLEHYFTRTYRLEVSAYHYAVDRLVSQVELAPGKFYFANGDRTKARGLEVELTGNHPSGRQARLSYALQQTEDSMTGDTLTSSPRHLAKLNLIQPLAGERLTAGLELQYHGSTRTLGGMEAGDFLLGNLTLSSRELRPGLELSVSAYNLFNTRYGYPGAVDHIQDVLFQPGRTLRVKATYRF
jgi:iron complex outermembrane receptor protein